VDGESDERLLCAGFEHLLTREQRTTAKLAWALLWQWRREIRLPWLTL
jgi:hypothetical protein